jgi:hypothetical protein
MSDGNNNTSERIKYTQREERSGPARIAQLRNEKTDFTVIILNPLRGILSVPLDI